MTVRSLWLVLCASVALSGCASLTFYDNDNMQSPQKGLKFYYAKPYLLVARDGTAKVTSITVQYLPDLEHPVFAKAQAGYGASNLTLAFSNGVITSFGQQVDTKVPETVSALGTLIPGYGSAVKALTDAAIEKKNADKPSQQASDLPKDAAVLAEVADSLRHLAGSRTFVGATPAAMRTIADSLNIAAGQGAPQSGIAAALTAPGAAAHLDTIAPNLKAVSQQLAALKAPDGVTGAAQNDWAKLSALQAQVTDVLKDIQPKSQADVPTPVLSLYEIKMEAGKTTLVEVPLPASLAP